MDDSDLVEVNLMDLDLNQEPRISSSAGYDGSWVNEVETVNHRIEERIRQLEAVTARARQRQRWRQARNSMELRDFPGESMVVAGERGRPNSGNSMGTVETGIGCKRDSSHLVARALEMDSMVKKADKEGGSFFDCNICLDVAREPILTCCGHLFCWPCFYQVSEIDSSSKECPVCKGEVSNNMVIPIYGNGDAEPMGETESGLKIPPRPKACRVESVRQQRVQQGLSHVPVAEALRRIRISIGTIGNQAQQQEGGGGILNYDATQEGENTELGGGGHRFRIHQVSRVLSESVASLSSLSSALSNAERLVENLETVLNNRILQNNVPQASPFDARTRPTVLQSNNQPPESAAGINAALPIASSSQSTAVPVTAAQHMRARILAYNRYPRETRRRRLN